jgi:hypothetical protein
MTSRKKKYIAFGHADRQWLKPYNKKKNIYPFYSITYKQIMKYVYILILTHYDNVKKEKENWYDIFYPIGNDKLKVSPDKFQDALTFLELLDNKLNNDEHNKTIKTQLHKIINYWLLNKKKDKIAWTIFKNRLYCCYIRAFYQYFKK